MNIPSGQHAGMQFVPVMSLESISAPTSAPFSVFHYGDGVPNINYPAFVINMPGGTYTANTPAASAQSIGSAISAMLGGLAGGTLQDPMVRILQASLYQGNRGRKPSPAALTGVFHVCLQDGDNVECPISSETLNAGEWVSRMPCGHYFSHGSLSTWLSENNSCPVCRYELHTGMSCQKITFCMLWVFWY
jgi:hypothetical protein